MAKKVTKKATKKVAEKKVVKKVVAKKATAPKVVVVKEEIKKVENVNNNSYVVIDYPVQDDTISSKSGYVIKIGASFDGFVEISFDNGKAWYPCRYASGYWWFDWTNFKAGNYKISTRLVGNDRKVLKVSDVRSFKVS